MKPKTQLLTTGLALLLPQLALATFTFNSNGTGADGDWTLDETDCPDADTPITLDVGESGIKQFSSITINENCAVTFTPTGGGSSNYSQPVRLIVTGDVVIDGTLNLNGESGNISGVSTQVVGGRGGPGGFDGGSTGIPGSASYSGGFVGYGPGGGAGNFSISYGDDGSLTPAPSDRRLQPLIGGSGGGGSFYTTSSTRGSGGGGGGAILIASSGSIAHNGVISARGGAGGNGNGDGGDGAAGVIHLVANQISGNGEVQSARAIFETLDNRSTFTGATHYTIEFQQLSLDLSPSSQQIQITQLGGEAVTPGTPLVLEQAGEQTLQLSSSGLAEDTTIRVTVSNSRAQTVTTADATLHADGNGSVTLTLQSGVMMVVAYVVE